MKVAFDPSFKWSNYVYVSANGEQKMGIAIFSSILSQQIVTSFFLISGRKQHREFGVWSFKPSPHQLTERENAAEKKDEQGLSWILKRKDSHYYIIAGCFFPTIILSSLVLQDQNKDG